MPATRSKTPSWRPTAPNGRRGRARRPVRPDLSKMLDATLEASVVGSFSRIGYLVRRTVEAWPDPPRIDGKVVVVTGASSGIGRAAALALGNLGAEVWVLGRDPARSAAVAGAIRSNGGRSEAAIVDLAARASVDSFAERFGSGHDRLDGLLHCAGALLRHYELSSDGHELTVATHLLGPFRLTWHLAPLLQRAGRSTIVTVSSGGMYTQGLDLDQLEAAPPHFDGVRAYARAKRAQVVLAGEWSRRWGVRGVASYAMHPGWVDTPGLESGLPSLRLGPLLRTPEEGADTAVWLATGAARQPAGGATGAPAEVDGFWHDRHRRGEHYLPWTRPREGHDEQGRELWNWCAARNGLGNEP